MNYWQWLIFVLSTIVGRQSEGSIIREFNPNPIPDPNPKCYRRYISC